jgi:hypothetical protein
MHGSYNFSIEMAAHHATGKMLDGAMILGDGLILKALESCSSIGYKRNA